MKDWNKRRIDNFYKYHEKTLSNLRNKCLDIGFDIESLILDGYELGNLYCFLDIIKFAKSLDKKMLLEDFIRKLENDGLSNYKLDIV